MFRQVNIEALQKVTDQNFDDFGSFPRQSFDTYTSDLYGLGSWYVGFNVVDDGSGRVTVSQGRVYFDGVGYLNADEGGNTVDLLLFAPTALSRWVAIIVAPDLIDTDTKPTTFLTNTTSRATVARPQSQESLRYAKVDKVVGEAKADPGYPTIGSNLIAVAYVLLDSTGVVKIEPNFGQRAPTTVGNAARLIENDQWRARTSVQIAGLGSNIAAIQGRLADSPSGVLVRMMAQDLARVRDQLGLPQNYTAYSSDSFLDVSQSQIDHADYAARVEEGIRFPAAAVQDKQLGLLNIYDEGVITTLNNIIPKYTEDTRLNNTINLEALVPISQYNYQDIAYAVSGASRTRLRVGPYFNTCTNWLEYYGKGATYDALNNILRLSSGEMFQYPPDVADYIIGNGLAGVDTHTPLRMRQVWVDQGTDEPYPAHTTVAGTASGSIIGQTFLNPQDGYLARIGIAFGQIGAAGNVEVMIAETFQNGQPNFQKILGKTTIPYANLKVGNVDAYFAPLILLQKGKMYAIVIVSVGNHSVYVSTKNYLTNGSFFQCTDGRWAVADIARDLCFYLTMAQFNVPRVEVQLQPLALDGGMTAIDVLAQMIVPSGCSAAFEAQFNGAWRDLTTLTMADSTPLNGLPALLPFRVVLTGTRDIMPMIGVGPNSRVRTLRPATAFRHISKPKTPPAPVKTITVETRLEHWDANTNTAAVKVRTGAGYTTITGPTAVQDVTAPEDPQAIIRTSVFVLGATVTSYLIDIAGTTSNVVRTFHVANRTDVSTNP